MAEGTTSDPLSHVKEGFLYKQGGNKKGWNKRYFTLKEGKVEYFKKEGDKKVRGTIELGLGRGVREKDKCGCKWPSSVEDGHCFGLAIETRTYYFYTTSEEGNVEEWKTVIQNIINKVGSPTSDWKNDKDGKPEGSTSFIARKSASLGAKVTKTAVKHAPVDSKVKNSVSLVANVVEGQADADPNAGIGERLATGVGSAAGPVGDLTGTGQAGEIVAKVVEKGAEVVKEVCKENNV